MWDRARKEGVVEEGTGGRGVLEEEEEESPAGSSREPREVGYRTDMQRRRGQKASEEGDRTRWCSSGEAPFATLKSDKDAMSSSSSRVAQEAEILACC